MSEKLLSNFNKGDKRALSRIISYIDNRMEKGLELMNSIYKKTGNAKIIGFTGPPGAGKSTLVNELIRYYRNNDETVAVLAIDPSSPYTEGAILGDRIRMLEFTSDEGVYVRSLASRGHQGGLSESTFECISVLDAFGFDIVIIETVGAGQSEVEIVKNCDTTVVLSVPGLGDDIQLLKAGIMEIANIFVVNKADLLGAPELASQIKNLIKMDDNSKWIPTVCLVSALKSTGIQDLINKIDDHRAYLIEYGIHNSRHGRFKSEFIRRLHHLYSTKIETMDERIEVLIKSVYSHELTFEAALQKANKLFLKS